MSDAGSPHSGVAGTTPHTLALGKQPLHLPPPDPDPPAAVRRSLAFDAPSSSSRSSDLPAPDVLELLQSLTRDVAQLRAKVRQRQSTTPSGPVTSQSAGGTRRSLRSHSSLRPLPPQPSAGGNRFRTASLRPGAQVSHNAAATHIPHVITNELDTHSSHRPSKQNKEDIPRWLERKMDAKIQRAQMGVKRGQDDPRLMRMSRSPFVSSIASYAAPAGFVPPRFNTYDGRQDPYVHLSMFRSAMYPYGSSDAQLCSLFPGTIGEQGLRWFDKLPAANICSFAQLAEQFVARFKTNVKTPKEAGALLSIWRGRTETLKDYNRRYWDLYDEIEGCSEDFAISSYKYGLSPGQSLRKTLTRTPPTTLQELQHRVNQEIRVEEDEQPVGTNLCTA